MRVRLFGIFSKSLIGNSLNSVPPIVRPIYSSIKWSFHDFTIAFSFILFSFFPAFDIHIKQSGVRLFH